VKAFVRRGLAVVAASVVMQSVCFAGNGAEPAGDPVVEPATLKCFGAYWVIKGDDNKDAKVEVAYRKAGTEEWKAGPALFRVARGANPDKSIKVGEGAWLFAGSVIDVPEATEYEMRLTLSDPDGGKAEKIIKTHTIAEPKLAEGGPTYYVTPGSGGGKGTKEDPFKGIAAAEEAAKPGDLFLLHAGTYEGDWNVKKSGEEGKPIVWRGAGDGEAILHAEHPVDEKGNVSGHMVDASGRHDVWFENLTFKGKVYSDIAMNDSSRIVVRGCHLYPFSSGIVATKESGKMGQFFIVDNVIEGTQPFGATAEQWHDIPENRGIWVGGRGNVIAYNRVHNTKDGIDTAEIKNAPQFATDIHNNEIYNNYDDGIELDGSWRNVRAFNNRLTSTLTGISIQPVHGGPIYIYRNVLYNVKTEFFKMHNDPTGVLFVHNTCVHHGPVWFAHGKSMPNNCYSRNNLMIGSEGIALDIDMGSKDLDFDYDGFGGFSGPYFLKVKTSDGRKILMATPEETRKKSPIEKHVVAVDPAKVFAGGLKTPEAKDVKEDGSTGTMGLKVYKPEDINLQLAPDSGAVDAGEVLPGLNNGFTGKAPDLGAYEAGSKLPQYGPRK
jgi:hypothetical protein